MNWLLESLTLTTARHNITGHQLVGELNRPTRNKARKGQISREGVGRGTEGQKDTRGAPRGARSDMNTERVRQRRSIDIRILSNSHMSVMLV